MTQLCGDLSDSHTRWLSACTQHCLVPAQMTQLCGDLNDSHTRWLSACTQHCFVPA